MTAPAPRGCAEGAPTHPDLVELAGDIRTAVLRDDVARVHVLLCDLRTALVEHLHCEHDVLASLPASLESVVANGQQRLLHLVDEAILDADGGTNGCNCLVRGARIDVALRRQALLESKVLDRHPR